jgi:hypothetical protein
VRAEIVAAFKHSLLGRMEGGVPLPVAPRAPRPRVRLDVVGGEPGAS